MDWLTRLRLRMAQEEISKRQLCRRDRP